MRGTYEALCRCLILAATAFLLTILTSSIAWSQQVTGRVEGYLRNTDGESVSGATITMSGPDLQGLRTSTSLADGYFIVEVLPVGTYEVRIGATGYIESVLADITVRLGRTTSLGVVTIGYPLHEIETMVVTAKSLLVDPGETVRCQLH